MSKYTPTPNTLAGFFEDLARSTSKDSALPFLTVIRLHTADGLLHGWSTDSYRAAHAVVPVGGGLSSTFYISRNDALAAAKALKGAAVVEVSDAVEDKLTLSDGSVTLTYQNALSDNVFPNLTGSAIPEELPDEHSPVMFQAEYLADFAAIGKRRKAYIEFVPATRVRPTHVRIGDEYRAWQMPLNPPEKPEHPPVWLPHAWES